MKFQVALILAVWTLLFGLAGIASPVSAHEPTQQSAAQRCFARHQFGAQPVDVAKTADGQTVLAQTSWNWHDSIGCYLTLDNQAVAALRAAPPPPSLPDAETQASKRCFEHHKFGKNPVDVAKAADGQTVLARLSWGYHNAIGCYLTLDNTALTTLRKAEATDDSADTTDSDTTPTSVATSNHRSIAAGGAHACAIKTDDTIVCWGSNQYHQSDPRTSRYTTITAGLYHLRIGRYTAIAAGDWHSCAIKTDGGITCWGNNGDGQTNAPPGRYTAIAAGGSHSCAINAASAIACWGDNEDGQTDSPPGRYTAIAASGDYSCAINTAGAITCWGYNGAGQTDSPPGRYTAIAAGGGHSCAIRADQTIACWGNNRIALRDTPGHPPRGFTVGGQADPPLGRYTAIAAGGSHSCAINTAGAITCWGDSRGGQTHAPPGRYTAIAAGIGYSCAINTAGAITCWGESIFTELETPDTRYTAIAAGGDHMCAIKINGTTVCGGIDSPGIDLRPGDSLASNNISIAAGGDHSCTIKTDGSIACWGDNREGQANAPPGRYTAITAGGSHSCAMNAASAIACWGNNQNGQTNAPPGRYTAITAGFGHSCAIKTDGTIACWGDNGEGQANAPPGRYTAITASWGHSCAIRADQTIACWGNNYQGWSDPPAGRYTAVAAGAYHSCAIKTDQTITCWGNNQDGQTDSPPGSYTAITAGWYHTCAIGVDTRMTCWGNGGFGPTFRPSRLFRSPRGNITVDIHICTTTELRSTISAQFLDDAVDSLNEKLAPIYYWESSGNLSVRFEAGQVLETPITDGRPFACVTQEQQRTFVPGYHRRPISLPHFINYTGVHRIEDGVLGADGLAFGLLSVTNIRPQSLLSGLTEREFSIIQHELDHAMLDVDHINNRHVGPNRLDPSVYASIGQKLSQFDPSLSTLLPEALACFDRIRLGWPVGDSSPICVLASPAAPTEFSFDETAAGNILLRWSRYYDPSNRRLATGYKIQVQTYEGEIFLTREVSTDTTQLQLPRLPPGEYSAWLSTVSSVGSSLFPTSVTIIIDPQ